MNLTIRETRHGPVISDLGGGYGQAPAGAVLALQATWLMDDDRSPQALWEVDRAGTVDEFRAALGDYVAPQQNLVFADVDGNIGFFAPGRVPIRGKGDGWLPAPGWTGDYDWTGYVPVDQLPSSLNPVSGRFVSANNKIVPGSYPYFLGRGWDLPNRAERINELLELIPQQSPAASAAIQADTLSPMAKALLPLMLKATPASKEAEEALDRLRAWDGRMERGQVAPLIFAAWLREFNRTVFADKLGPVFDDYWGMHPNTIQLVLTEHGEWCDDPSTPAVETCNQQLGAALERALAQLRGTYGDAMKNWSWGHAHEAQFNNAFWSNTPLLRSLFATAIPANGGYDTVDTGSTPIARTRDPYADIHGPTLRMIVDLAKPDAAQFMISPGQSGNVLSPHYSDLLQPWRDHGYLTLDGPPTGGTLVLAPQ